MDKHNNIFNNDLLDDILVNEESDDYFEEEDDDEDDEARNKKSEEQKLKEELLEQLSPETVDVILENNKKMDEIIEGLRKKGLNKSEGIDLSRFKTIVNSRSR